MRNSAYPSRPLGSHKNDVKEIEAKRKVLRFLVIRKTGVGRGIEGGLREGDAIHAAATLSISLSFLVSVLVTAATMAIVLISLLGNACAENRVALVIGNAAYPTAPLSNPRNDANAMQETLTTLGFDVTKRVDAGRKEMRAIIRQFGERLQRPGTVALFFYSGHGNQVNGRNYMIPVDADVRSEIDIESDGVFVGEVLQTMEASNSSVNIVILDACRDNPYEKSFKTMSKGLARMEAPNGTLIVYATAPGAVADNGPAGGYSPFTAALIDAIARPDISALDMFNEVERSVQAESESATAKALY